VQSNFLSSSSHGLSPEIHVGEAEALESAKRARAATGDES